MSLFKTTYKGTRQIFALTAFIFVVVLLFSRINFEPSSLIKWLVITTVTIVYITWCYRVNFKYQLVRETNDTIFNSYYKTYRVKMILFSLLTTVGFGSVFAILVAQSLFFLIGAIAYPIQGQLVEIPATCDYSSRNKFYGISNYLITKDGNTLHVKSAQHHCGVFSSNAAECVVSAEQNILGYKYKSIACY